MMRLVIFSLFSFALNASEESSLLSKLSSHSSGVHFFNMRLFKNTLSGGKKYFERLRKQKEDYAKERFNEFIVKVTDLKISQQEHNKEYIKRKLKEIHAELVDLGFHHDLRLVPWRYKSNLAKIVSLSCPEAIDAMIENGLDLSDNFVDVDWDYDGSTASERYTTLHGICRIKDPDKQLAMARFLHSRGDRNLALWAGILALKGKAYNEIWIDCPFDNPELMRFVQQVSSSEVPARSSK